jgi:hypothetical protein
MSRLTLAICLSGLLVLSLTGLGLAQVVVAPPVALAVQAFVPAVAAAPAVQPQCQVFERMVGTWEAQAQRISAETSDQPKPIGRVTRQWVVEHKFLQERGSQHEAYLTFDPRRNAYCAWYFHANGHVLEMTGQWTGNWMMFSLSADVDQNQGLQRNFMVQNDQNHECTVTWTDENGRTGIFATLRYARIDAAKTDKSANAASPPKVSPPDEMKIFADEIGKWTIEGSAVSGDKTTKVSGTTTAQWILGGRFVQTTATIQGRKGDNICVAGFDAATKTYRCWYFDPEGSFSEPAVGTWDEKEHTMSWKEKMTSEIVMVKKKQWINHDTAKIHAVYTRPNGSVEATQDGTITRQKAAG